jgi:hypothetical protein
MSNVIRFPTTGAQHIYNRRGKRAVPCRVTDRFLRFTDEWQKFEDGTYIFVNVMTDGNDKERQLASLCVTLEDLKKVIRLVEEDIAKKTI